MSTATAEYAVSARTDVRPRGRVAHAVLGTAAAVVLGTWFGGLAALILFVSTLFVRARRVAVEAAPVLFFAFERYQLVVAAAALATLIAWWLVGRHWAKAVALAAAGLATALAGVQIGYVTPVITATQNTDRARFDRFHHLASVNYTATAALVLLALLLALTAARRGTGPATARA